MPTPARLLSLRRFPQAGQKTVTEIEKLVSQQSAFLFAHRLLLRALVRHAGVAIPALELAVLEALDLPQLGSDAGGEGWRQEILAEARRILGTAGYQPS